MGNTTISDAVVFPEDEGTGVADGDEDFDSAAYHGLVAQALPQSAIQSGLTFSDVNTTDTSESVNVDAGAAVLIDDASVTGGQRSGKPTVQSGSQDTYDTTLPSGADPAYIVILPTQTGDLSLDTDVVNELWLFVEPDGGNDAVKIRHGSSEPTPSNPSHKLGTVNASDGSTSEQWGLAAGDGTLTYPDFDAANSTTHAEGTTVYDRDKNDLYVEDGT